MIKNLAKTIRPHLFFLVFAFAMVATLTFLGLRFMVSSSAATFRAGNIMSDAVMSDYNSMTLSEIQSWLSYNNPCNNHNYNLYLDQSNKYNWKGYYWHWSGPANSNGHFVCLSEERFGDGEVIGSGQTAAEIIYQAAQDYRINPQVLLVTLEKEQSLISDKFPNSHQYQRATGYGCPDNTGGACSAEYYGFKNQVRHAAALYREVLDGSTRNNKFPAYNTVYVQYHPYYDGVDVCGGTNVYIENRATSALYRYTPYQPGGDAAAGCAAYGNLNFFNLFTNWFGSTWEITNYFTTARYIPDGIYEILPRTNEQLAVDIDSAQPTDGTNIQAFNRNHTGAQEWQFIYNSTDETYTIKNPTTGKVMDIAGGVMDNRTNIRIWSSNNSCAQKWRIAKNNAGYYVILSACNKYMAMETAGGGNQPGTNIQIYNSNSTNAQQFKLLAKQTVANGYYTISPGTNHNTTLDISGGVLATYSGSNLQIFNKNNTQAQEWQVNYDANDGTYSIINPFTRKSLDVAGAGTSNGVNIRVWDYNGSCAQKWWISSNMDGSSSIFSSCSGKAMDVAGGSSSSGANVQQYTPNGTLAQLWDLRPVSLFSISDDVYTIIPKLNESLALDVYGGSDIARNGTNVWDFYRNRTDAQKWRIKPNDDGTYTIINPASQKVLDIASANMSNGSNIQLWFSNNTCAQKWKIATLGDGYLTFVSSCASRKVIDVAGGFKNSGTNVHVWDYNYTAAQQWKITNI